MPDPILGVDITRVKTSTEGAEWPLGTRWTDPQTGYEYRYINADTAIADGDALTETVADGDNPFALVPTSAVAQVIRGIGIAAIAAEGFGWVLINGKKASAKVTDASVAGDFLVTTATAGRLGTFIPYTTVDPTKTQLDAGLALSMGLPVRAISDGDANNLGTVWIGY